MSNGVRCNRAMCVGLLGFCVFGGSGGCGGQFGESVSVPQGRQHRVTGGLAAGERLVFPQQSPFVVTDAQRQSTGTGKAESAADKAGAAYCNAAVEGQGTAAAEFQLGHVIHNDTDQAVAAQVSFDVEYELTLSGNPPPKREPAVVALKVYVSNSQKVTLHRVSLVSQSDILGPERHAGREAPSFQVRLEPRLAYHLIVAGKVAVSGSEQDGPLAARVEVKRLQVEVQGR